MMNLVIGLLFGLLVGFLAGAVFNGYRFSFEIYRPDMEEKEDKLIAHNFSDWLNRQ
jgi:hypothetical protein